MSLLAASTKQDGDAAAELLERGDAFIGLDPRSPGVSMPTHLVGQPQLVSQVPKEAGAVLDAAVWKAALGKMRWRRLVYAATLALTVALLGAALVLPPPDAEPDFGIAIGVWALTLSVAIAGIAIPTRWLHHSIQSLELVVGEEVNPVGDYRSPSKSRRVVDLDEAALRRVEWVTRTPFGVSMVLPVVLGVLGLTLHRMGHEPLVCVPIILLSIVLTASRYPSNSRLVQAISDALEAAIRF